METNNFISIRQICVHYNLSMSFIDTLRDYDLIEVVRIRDITCINKSHIKDLERIIRLHYELEINLEGIDAIYNLLKQVEFLQEDIIKLSNRLKRYEDN